MPASPPLTPQQQLAFVPLRNAKVRVLEETHNRMQLEVEVVYSRWLGPLPRLLGAKQTKKVQLDGLALAVWRRIDDRINLGNLIDALAAEEQLEFNEARLLTLQFLRLLSLRGLIVLGDRTGLG